MIYTIGRPPAVRDCLRNNSPLVMLGMTVYETVNDASNAAEALCYDGDGRNNWIIFGLDADWERDTKPARQYGDHPRPPSTRQRYLDSDDVPEIIMLSIEDAFA